MSLLVIFVVFAEPLDIELLLELLLAPNPSTMMVNYS
jgi:hypothetical protein